MDGIRQKEHYGLEVINQFNREGALVHRRVYPLVTASSQEYALLTPREAPLAFDISLQAIH